jgi:iron-sulfur cluster assembly protein
MAAILTLTDSATTRVRNLLAAADKPVAGLRLSTPQRGCSGLMYKLDYVETPNPKDEIVDTQGGRLFIDGASLLYLLGSEMDWKEDDFTAGFVFANPNAKGACGCGESFHV